MELEKDSLGSWLLFTKRTLKMIDLYSRPRRNRKSAGIRQLISETSLSSSDFVWPVFLIDSEKTIKKEIPSMPGVFHWSLPALLVELEELIALGLKAVAPFPLVDDKLKDSLASYASAEDNFYLQAIQEIKSKFPDLIIFSDVAMDPYSSDGHDGVLRDGKILNDESIEVLVRMSLAQAKAGADVLAPSDMMDGRIAAIRGALDAESFVETSLMSYSVKYCSFFYSPFRDALQSAPKSGDKKTYQMDPANFQEALREIDLDIQEGADFLMVKPAMSYLDVLCRVKESSDLPVSAYQVSGEYAMIQRAFQSSQLSENPMILETLLSIKRAGADFIFSYFTPYFLRS